MAVVYPRQRWLAQAFVLLLLITVCSPQLSHAIVLFQNDFEDDPVGTYTVENLSADWNGTTSNDGVDEGRVSITDDANAFGNKSLVVMYPEGESNQGKTQWKVPLPAYEELFVSYRIRFGDNFDFKRGGKLPGLSGGDDNTGGNKPDGTDGWSARMMWRTNGSGGSPTTGDTANIVQYTYHPDQPTDFGDDMRWDDTTPTDWQEFASDRWYYLQHRIKMNTPGTLGNPGQHDGIVQAWLDGEMVLDRQDIRFRDIDSLKIDNFLFSTFFGGSSEPWEASKDEYVYFDDFIIATEFITIPADFTENGIIDGADLANWSNGYGSSNAAHSDGDANGDNDVDGHDFLTWQRANMPSYSPGQFVGIPEPTAVFLSLSSAIFMLACGGRSQR